MSTTPAACAGTFVVVVRRTGHGQVRDQPRDLLAGEGATLAAARGAVPRDRPFFDQDASERVPPPGQQVAPLVGVRHPTAPVDEECQVPVIVLRLIRSTSFAAWSRGSACRRGAPARPQPSGRPRSRLRRQPPRAGSILRRSLSLSPWYAPQPITEPLGHRLGDGLDCPLVHQGAEPRQHRFPLSPRLRAPADLGGHPVGVGVDEAIVGGVGITAAGRGEGKGCSAAGSCGSGPNGGIASGGTRHAAGYPAEKSPCSRRASISWASAAARSASRR